MSSADERADDPTESFTAEEMEYGKKEAKAKLGAARFRKWKDEKRRTKAEARGAGSPA